MIRRSAGRKSAPGALSFSYENLNLQVYFLAEQHPDASVDAGEVAKGRQLNLCIP